MNRKQKADEKYRRLFYELGYNVDFDYLGFEKKDRLRFRCRRCGLIAPRGNDIFKGRQTRMICRHCGNGSLLYSLEVDEVLAFYSEGHSVAETCEKYNVKRSTLNDWVKYRKVTNGRSFVGGGQECNRKRAEETPALGRVLRNASHYQRAKLHGAPAVIGITLPKLFKRDGGVCQLCGLPCFYGNDSVADLYPTIDHITPISKGGGHTWDNVQLAHRVCNLNKSNLIGKEWNNGND